MTRPGRDSGPRRKILGPTVQNLGWLATPDYTSEIIDGEVRPRIRAGRSLIDAAQSHRIDGETALQGAADILESSERWLLVAQHPTSTSDRAGTDELVAPCDIAARLGVASNTPSMWRIRNLLPAPVGVFGRVPVWRWETIKIWAEKTGRLRVDA